MEIRTLQEMIYQATAPCVRYFSVPLLVAAAVLLHWRVVKLNVESAFPQSGAAAGDVYVTPPIESKDYGK